MKLASEPSVPRLTSAACCWSLISFLAPAILFVPRNLSAQVGGSGTSVPDKVMLTSLYPPVYPRLAAQAAIHGDVELDLLIGRDGALKSVNVINGHSMLREAAIDSAKKSQFECTQCSSDVSYSLTCQFRIMPTDPDQYCSNTAGGTPPPKLDSSSHQVVVFAEEMWTCDPAVSYRKVRSPKCLYLWKCGIR